MSVSVLLPVFNGERYLAESIESVLHQTYEDFELLITDDGSSDRSRAIIESYSDPRIRRFVNPHNQGLFRTLNTALAEARGELVRFWSQDDRMKAHCLAAEVEFWRRHPEIGMSYCQWDGIDADGVVVYRPAEDGTPEVVEPWLATQISFYFGCMPGNISAVMAQKAVIEEVGGFADMIVSGDFDLWTRMFAKRPLGFLRAPLVEVRLHGEQFSRARGSGVAFIREDREILRRLWLRIPPELQAFARAYHVRTRAPQYVQYIFRGILRGDFRVAWAALSEVRSEGPLPLLLFWWAISGNGRWFRPRPRYSPPVGG